MKKGLGRLLSIVISMALMLGCIPQTPGLILPVQAAEVETAEVEAVEAEEVEAYTAETEQSTVDGSMAEEPMTEAGQVVGPTEDEAPLTDEDIAKWMDESGLGSGRVIRGADDTEDRAGAVERIEKVYYRSNIIVDNVEKENLALKDAFWLAQTSSKEKVPEIRLKTCMYTDEAITIKSGKTIHLKLNNQSLFRGPKNTGKDNTYYIMDNSERQGCFFILEENAKLIITGGKLGIEAKDTRYEQKSVPFRENEKEYTYKTGRLVGGFNSGKGGAIYADAKSTVDLRDLTIANCAAEYGGTIYAESQANILLTNTKIVDNYGSTAGGAIYLNGAKGVLTMDNDTEITANRSGKGGAIALDSEKMIVAGNGKTSIHDNLAESYGGAIYLPNNSGNSVAGIKFANNTAQKYGGAIYANGKEATISDCEFKNNYAKWGGGIYINAKNCGVSSVKMEENKANSQGGAIWVDSMDDLAISGTTVIKNNSSKDFGDDNVALQNGLSTQSYICLGGALGAGSEVCVHDSDKRSRRLTAQPGTFDARDFHVDGRQKHVEHKEDRHLYIVDGKEEDPTKNKGRAEVSNVTYTDWKNRDITKATSESDGKTNYQFAATDGSYPVYYGYVSSPSHTTENADIVNKFYYSDGYFFSDPKKYDKHLAAFGMNMAMASADSNVYTHEDYRFKFTNIKSLMEQIGVDEQNVYINSWYAKKPTDDSIGVAIGKKTIRNKAGDDHTLVIVSIRSYGYEKEWASNMTINGGNTDDMKDEHSGFKSARTHVMDELKYYISNYGLEGDLQNGKVKFFLTGFSRGSATANLTGKYLVDTYGENSSYKNKNQVYAYCYGVPAGGTDYRDNSKQSGKTNECYFCIHNIINKVDLTPMVAPYEMKFKRYGVDHYIPGDPTVKDTPQQADKPAEVETKVNDVTLYYDNDPWYVGSTQYNTQREKMVKQLLAVNDEINFSDYFKEYYITMGRMNALINHEGYTFNKSKSNKKLENWLPEFYHKVQNWNIIAGDKNLTRENYSNYAMKEGEVGKQWYDSGVSAQDALRGLVMLVLSKTPEEKSKLMAAMGGVTKKFSTPVIGSGNSLLTLYDDLIGSDQGWDKSRAIQQKWLDDVWNKLTDNRYGQRGIQDAMSSSELKDFKSYYPTVMGLVFRILKYDYDNAGKMDKSTKEEMWLAGTFAKNTETILQGHVPEIALAWLRSYDEWYDNDLKKIAFTGDGSATVPEPGIMKKDADGNLVAITENEVLNGENQTIYLTDNNSGAGVFYTLEHNGSRSDSTLYNGNGIEITKPGSYTITTYAINDHAAEVEKPNHDKFWSKKWKESAKQSRSFKLDTVATHEIYYKERINDNFNKKTAKEGDELHLTATIMLNRPFLGWKVTEDEQGTKPYINEKYKITEENLKKKDLDILIPDRTVYIRPDFTAKTVSVETVGLEKVQVGKPLPTSVTGLSFKNEGSDSVVTYPSCENIKVLWSYLKQLDSGEKSKTAIFGDYIAKADETYIADVRIPSIYAGTTTFIPDTDTKAGATVEGYKSYSKPYMGVSEYVLYFETTDKTPGEEPAPTPVSKHKITVKRTLINAEDSDRTAFEDRLNNTEGGKGLYYEAEKDAPVPINTEKLLFEDETGKYIPVAWKVIPENLTLYDEAGAAIPTDTEIIPGSAVINEEAFTVKMPETDFTLEAIYAYASTIKEIDVVLEEPEKGEPLTPTPEEAKIKVVTNNTEKEYVLDPLCGFTISYWPEGKGEEKLAEAATAYSADVEMKFDALKEKQSQKTLSQLLGYSYDGIFEENDNVVIKVKTDYDEELEAEDPGLIYDEDEEQGYWSVIGYGFEVDFDTTDNACILAVYDEDAWFTVKKDENSGKLILEDELADDLEDRTADATWEGLSKLLPTTVDVISDDSSVDSLPVTWDRPGSDDFTENVLNTQMFTVIGRVAVPDGMLVYNSETEEVEKQSHIEVWCDVIIETTESAEKPYAMPAGGTYYKNVSITLKSDTEDAKIYYTLDGTEPLDDLGRPVTGAKLYENDIYIDTPGDTTIKAAAVKDGFDNSETLMERYTIANKAEADIPEEDLDIISGLFLEDGMCLDDLTPELPEGWSWDEDLDIYYEYWLDELVDEEDSDNNMLFTAYGALVYNPDPTQYADSYIEIDIPIYESTYYVDVIDGEAFDSDGDPLYGAESGETVYLVADYPLEADEDYVFVKWVAKDEDGNDVQVTMADDEHASDYPEPLIDEESGELFDGAASFTMPDDDVIVKAIFERYDQDKQKIEEKTVSSLQLDKSELKLKAGDDKSGSGTVTATVAFEGEGKEPQLTLRASDSEVIQLVQTGNTAAITAIKAGESVIWAVCGDKVAKCNVTVEPGPADAVNVTVKNGKAVNDSGSAVTTAVKGDVLTLVADKPATGYEFKKWTITGTARINGDTTDPTATVKITVGTKDINAEAVFGIADSYDDDFKPKDADVPVKKLTVDPKEYYLIPGNDFTLKAEAVYNEKQPEIEFRSNNPGVVTVSAEKTVGGKASAVVHAVKAGEATVYAYCGNKTAKCKVYVNDGSSGIELTGNNKKTLIDLKAGEQITLDAKLMPEDSVKQVASVKYQILSRFDVASLNAPLKNVINDYPDLKAMSGSKLPSIASASKGLITAKWDKKLAAGNTSAMTVLRVTMKLVKYKGEKKAVEYVCDYPVRVTATDNETKGYKNTVSDKSYKLAAKAARSTLDAGVAGMGETVVTATINKAEMKDLLAIEFISTNENVIKIENAQTTAVPDAKGSKATATATAKAKGIGTAYVVVKSKNKTDETKYNLRTVKITVKSSSPKIVLVKDSEGLLPRDENTGDVVIDEATNSVTMTMRPGSYDRFTVDLKPYVTAYSTDATKLSWSASGGVTVKNGVVFAKKATKEGKPAKLTVKCAKSKPLTIYINVK